MRKGMECLKKDRLTDAWELLGRMKGGELRDIAVQYAICHSELCRLTDADESPGRHARGDEILKRMEAMSEGRLARLLAPMAALGAAVYRAKSPARTRTAARHTSKRKA